MVVSLYGSSLLPDFQLRNSRDRQVVGIFVGFV